MQIGKRIDVVDLAKRGILVDRKKAVEHIMRGMVKRFNIDIIYAWLNPIFNDTTDYIVIGKMPKQNAFVIFHAVAFGECSTAQFDMYASQKNLDEFYENLKENATCVPISVFEAELRSKGLSTNKGDNMYWMNLDKDVSKLVVEMLEDLSPQLSHVKSKHR